MRAVNSEAVETTLPPNRFQLAHYDSRFARLLFESSRLVGDMTKQKRRATPLSNHALCTEILDTKRPAWHSRMPAPLFTLHFEPSRHFAAEPLNQQSGELLWKELLMHGGARDPHRMLRALLGEAGDGGEAGVQAGIESMLKDMDISVPPSRE